MSSRVFISHASPDAAAAAALVAALEAAGIACWISSRDVAPGGNYQEAIVTAIRAGQAMVVLVSAAANASTEVKKELSLASAAGIPVYPVRLGLVTPDHALSYELATRQWIEGGEAPHLAAPRLVAALRATAAPAPTSAASLARPPDELALPDLPSIAVLPFANAGGDPDQEFFSDGVAEDILAELARDRRLFVIGRASSFTYRGRTVDLRQVGRELGVRYVLDGSVRRAGDRLRVSARLNDAITGAAIWSDRFDRDTTDMFAVQDEITAAVAVAIRPAVSDAEQSRARRKRPDSLTAWEAYQRGLWHVGRHTEADLDAAIAFMRQAVALDPQFGAAHTGLGGALFRLIEHGRASFAETARQCLEVFRTAVELDPNDVEAIVGCSAQLRWLGDIDGSGHILDDAARRFPNSPFVLRQIGTRQVALGDFAEGRRNLLAYLRTNPRDPFRDVVVGNIAFALYQERNYAAVAELAREVIASTPEKSWAYRTLAAALGQLGQVEAARAALHIVMTRFAAAFAMWTDARPPFQRPEDHAHYLDGLRKAGWRPKNAAKDLP